jgi:hypothetical protein
MSNLSTILFLAVFLAASTGLRNQMQLREIQVDADGVHNTLTQIAVAQHRRVSDTTTGNFGTYASTPAQLVAEGYLAVFREDDRYSITFPSARGFAILFDAETTGDAARIAKRFGQTAELDATDSSIVRVGFPSPEDLAIFDIFVKKSGDTMTGSLEMVSDSGADLRMNNNNIFSEGNVTIKNATGTANLDADTANTGSLTTQTFRVIN